MRKQAQVGRWAGGQIVVEELDTHCRPQATDRGPEGGGGLPNVSTPQLIDRKTGEQSENVYENKGRCQKVGESSAVTGVDPPLIRLAPLATLSPGKRAAEEVWSGTRSNARRCKNRENKARMSMKTNSRGVVKPNREVKRQDADCLSLLDSRLSTFRLEFERTKRECL